MKITTSTSLPPEIDALLDELTQKLLTSKDLGSGHQLAMAASTELMKHLQLTAKAIAEHLKVTHQYEATVATIRQVIRSHQKKA